MRGFITRGGLGQQSTAGGTTPVGSVNPVSQLTQVAQGGSTNSAGTVTSPLMQTMLVWAPPTGGLPTGGHYQIVFRIGYGLDADLPIGQGGQTTNNWAVITGLTNFFNAANIAQGPGSPIGPTTVFDFDVVTVDSLGNRSAKTQQLTMWGYRGGITGTASGGTNNTLTVAGSPWTTNQWLAYYLFVSGKPSAVIVGNTANTLTFVDLDGNQFSSPVSNGNAFQIGGDYFNGVGDVSFGKSAIDFTNAGGSPVSPHDFCLLLQHDGTTGNMGLQRPSASPAGFIYGLEIGAYNYAVWNQRSPTSGSYTEFAIHHRCPSGDLPNPPIANIAGSTMVSQGYGPAQVSNTWQNFKVPLSVLTFSTPASGKTTFSFTLNGSTLTVSGIAGPGMDNGTWVTGTGIPTGTFILNAPGGGANGISGNGSYTVSGAGIPVGGPVSASDGQGWATNMYKGQYKVVGSSFANLTWFYDDIGWVRSNSLAAGA